MPCVSSLDEFHRAVDEFVVEDLGLVAEPACLARQRPGIREVQIRYNGGRYWNFGSRQFAGPPQPPGPVRLYEDAGELVLDLPVATEAVVPQRPQSPPPPARTSP